MPTPDGKDLFGRSIDGESGGGVVIDTAHDRIHNGQAYSSSYLWGEGAEIADNANADFLLQIAEDTHAVFDIAAGGDAELRIYEAPTNSAAGTAVGIRNKNRESTNTSSATITRDPTITGTGTELKAGWMPGGSGPHSGGGAAGFSREWNLKEGVDYLVRLTNRAGAAKAASIGVEFYEPHSAPDS